MKKWDTVAIVGVGLVGGSIGRALIERQLADNVIGIGRRAASLNRAKKHGAVTSVTTNLSRGVTLAEIVVVCTPVDTIVPLVRAAAEHAPPECLLTDAGSTKGQIVAELDGLNGSAAAKRRSAAFVGSHPLAGSDKTGPEHSRADLFQGRVVVVTPTRRTRPEDFARTVDFWSALGASVVKMTPQAHDAVVAATSHVPHVVASALAAATSPEVLELVAGGWMDTTRVAAGDVQLWRQILLQNRPAVLKSLAKFEKVLTSFREALESGDSAKIARLLAAGKDIRDAVGG